MKLVLVVTLFVCLPVLFHALRALSTKWRRVGDDGVRANAVFAARYEASQRRRARLLGNLVR